jgi:hypothetical protein
MVPSEAFVTIEMTLMSLLLVPADRLGRPYAARSPNAYRQTGPHRRVWRDDPASAPGALDRSRFEAIIANAAS